MNQQELRLSLKTKWFEMTKAGIKTEDYRDINDYWFKRLVFDYKKVFKYTAGYDWDYLDKQSINAYLSNITGDKLKRSMIGFNPFLTNAMTLGYPKSTDLDRILKLEHKGIEIRTGNPEWGAEPNKLYFVIMHGAVIA
jgi:hypothetical protein